MKRICFLLCIICCYVKDVSAQVNSQTGTVFYNIPVFNFSDAKSGLSHQISIGYSSGNGLRVNDLASGMGQGWQLICGGSIIRKQNGEPDDQNSTIAFPTVPYNNARTFNSEIAIRQSNYQSFSYPGDCYSQDYVDNYYPNGFMYSEFPLDITEDAPLKYAAPRELAFMPRFKNDWDKRYKLSKRSLTDREQDVFIINVNGLSGEFVIGKDGTIVPIGDTKLQFEKTLTDMTSLNIRTRISSFKITDENGIIYTFDALTLSEALQPKEISNTGGDFSFSVSGSDGAGKYTVDQWGLTSIKNPFTNEEILFNYTETEVDYISQKLPSYSLMEADNIESVNLHEVRIKGKVKNLVSIIFPDGYSFWIERIGYRQDLNGDHRIDNLQIKFNGALISKIALTHSYFYKKEIRSFAETFSETDKRYLRMCLTGVQKLGADGFADPPFVFTYFTGSETTDSKDIVPPTDSYAQDHWGYYNRTTIINVDEVLPAKETFKSLMISNGSYRQPYLGSAKNGLIKTIKNPAAGELSFTYEQNIQNVTVNGQSNVISVGGVHVNTFSQYDGISHSNDILTSYSYTVDGSIPSAWGYEEPQYNVRRGMEIIKDNLGYSAGGLPTQQTTGLAVKNDLLIAVNKGLISLGISKIKSKSLRTVLNVVNSLRKAISSPPMSVGQQITKYGFKLLLSKAIEHIYLLLDPYDYDYGNYYQFYPYNYSNSLGNHFSKVIISNPALGNGKIIQEFSKPLNIATEILPNNFPYSDRQRYASWKYDLLKKEIIQNNLGNTVSETNYEYNISENLNNTNENLKSSKVDANYLHSARCEAASYNFPVSDLTAEFYYPITGGVTLTSTNQKNYSASGILSETNSSVQYNNDLLPNVSTITKSNGDQIITKTYYANNYNSSVNAGIALLKSKNAIAVPVLAETWLKKNVSNDEFLVDASLNEYTVLANNDVKVGKIYKLESKIPLPKSSVGFIDNSTPINTLIRTGLSPYLKLQTEFNYNSDGNLVETKSKGDDISSVKYGYNKRLIIASISNSTSAAAAYTSFEDGNTGQWTTENNWSYHPPSIVSDVEFTPTGNKCLSLNAANTTITSTVPINRTYILSFWAKSDGGVPSVGSLPVLQKTFSVNGWTYYEYKVSSTSGSVYIAPPGIIDEVRLYPDNSKMSTVTYNPAVGKTSECDVNNKIVYYEYDSLGRVTGIRDEKRNLIKTYEYHFKN